MNDILKSLKAAIFDVMERMFFHIPDPDGETENCCGMEGYPVSIGITGEPRYRITMVFDPHLASEMAADALGTETESRGETIRKCLLETINIVAGNFLHRLEGETDRGITLPSFDASEIFGALVPVERRTASFRFGGRPVSAVIETIPGIT
jgi:CheY-specific phosphatase CheX